MAWYCSEEWESLLGNVDDYRQAAIRFVRDTNDGMQPIASHLNIGFLAHQIVKQSGVLAPHIDVSPIWNLYLAIDHCSDVPPPPMLSATQWGTLVEGALLPITQLEFAGLTDERPLDQQQATGDIGIVEYSKADLPSQWAKRFGISLDTFQRRIKAGTIRVKKDSTKSYRIAVADLPSG